MKYWLVTLQITQGESETYDKSVHAAEKFERKDLDAYALDYMAEGEEVEPGFCEFLCGEVVVKSYGLKQITKKEYDVLVVVL